MRIAAFISLIITFLSLLSALICGLWIHSGQSGDINFHIYCGIVSIVFCCIAFMLLLITLCRQKGGK